MYFGNNIVSNSGGNGLDCGDGHFATRNYNDYFNNGGLWCTSCSAVDPNGLMDPPRFVDPLTLDLRLYPNSTLIDAGFDLGINVNGPQPMLFNGSAPEMGAWEAP